jgi:hypothetical protein
MPTNTRSNRPRNRSGLQRQSPAAEKRKRAESGADKSNKKPKASTNEATDDVDDDSEVMGKGKKAARGKGKGAKRARYVALTCHVTRCLRRLGKPPPTVHRTTLSLMQQAPQAILPGMCTPLTPSSSPTPFSRAERILEESGVSIAPPMRARSAAAAHLPPPPQPVAGRQRRSDAAKAQSSKEQPSHDGSHSDNSHDNSDNDDDENDDDDQDDDENEDNASNGSDSSNSHDDNEGGEDDNNDEDSHSESDNGDKANNNDNEANENDGEANECNSGGNRSEDDENGTNTVAEPHRTTTALTPNTLAPNTLVTDTPRTNTVHEAHRMTNDVAPNTLAAAALVTDTLPTNALGTTALVTNDNPTTNAVSTNIHNTNALAHSTPAPNVNTVARGKYLCIYTVGLFLSFDRLECTSW